MRGQLFLLIVSFLAPFSLLAQSSPDSSNLLSAFKKGTTSGHFRLYYMHTNNQQPLTDYHALAFGGGLKYRTAIFKGFQAGISGYYIWNLASTDLTRPDSVTGIMNRYEIGQFDQDNPENKKDLQRLEDFFISYNYKNSRITLGKQLIKTPFINLQDGRMRPTGVQGLWTEIKEIKKTSIELGWISKISPRGTVRWFNVASSIGIYPTGVNTGGNRSDYKHNLNSSGIAVAGLTYKPSRQWKIQVWDYRVDNIFNTFFLQAENEIELKHERNLHLGFQFFHQHSINQGGNPDLQKTYFDPEQKTFVFSTTAGIKKSASGFSLNYSRITSHGRFLFPREWGREPLFTFMPRERNEGLGDVHAFTMNWNRKWEKHRLLADVTAGYFNLPDAWNAALNKYGFPSYYQFNADIRYAFHNWLRGLNVQLLYLYKHSSSGNPGEFKYIINKVNMHQVNLVFNYNF